MIINSNHCNRAFSAEIKHCRAWLAAKVFDTCGYQSKLLLDRLAQRLVEIGRLPYAQKASAGYKTGSNGLPVAGVRLEGGRASIEMGSGRVILTARQWLSNQFDFLLHWGFCLSAIFATRKFRGASSPATLVLQVGEESIFKDGSDEQFVAFCRSGPVVPLRSGRRFIIQSVAQTPRSCAQDFSYVRRPLIRLLHDAKPGMTGWLVLVGNHFRLLASYLMASIRVPELSLIGRDFAYCGIANELDKRGLIESVVLTCSSFTSQELWLRGLQRAKVHMIWYAQNWRPVRWAAAPQESDIVELPHIAADEHWVWTRSFAAYLSGLLPHAAYHVVGPLLWYLPRLKEKPADIFHISVFDVSPFSDDVAMSYGDFPNYNHPDNLFAFMRDILALADALQTEQGIKAIISLKTKRGYNPAYDRAYFDHIEVLAANGGIRLCHHSTNLYSMISASHLVLAYPFTSPAYVATYLGVPAIYHDPTGEILDQDFSDLPARLLLTQRREALFKQVKALLPG